MSSILVRRPSGFIVGLIRGKTKVLVGRRLFSSRNMASKDKFTNRIAKEDDYNAIINFLNENFVPYEPTLTALNFRPNTPGMDLFWQSIAHCLTEPISFIYLNKQDEIVGSCLSSRFHPISEMDDRWTNLKVLPAGMSTFDICVAYVAKLEDGLVERLATKEQCNNPMLLNVLCVDSKCRGHGLGVKLIDLAFENARQRGYDCIISQATAKASQILFKRAGFDLLNVVKHEDFVDENGTRLLNCKDGTDEGQLVFKRL